jgi:general secretion pathway protein H
MGKQRSRHGGYTLIEILIVMLIISIVGVASLLTISANKNSRLETYAKQLSNLITLAQQQAMLEPAVLGLMIQKQTLTFYEYQQAIDAKHKSTWVPLTDTVLKPHRIPKEIELQLRIAEQSVSTQSPDPQLVISSSGDVTPFHIYVGEKNKSPLYQVTGQEDGSISSGKISHEK